MGSWGKEEKGAMCHTSRMETVSHMMNDFQTGRTPPFRWKPRMGEGRKEGRGAISPHWRATGQAPHRDLETFPRLEDNGGKEGGPCASRWPSPLKPAPPPRPAHREWGRKKRAVGLTRVQPTAGRPSSVAPVVSRISPYELWGRKPIGPRASTRLTAASQSDLMAARGKEARPVNRGEEDSRRKRRRAGR